MKIKLVNGNTIETIETKDTIRGSRYKLYTSWNIVEYRDLTKEEEELIKSFINTDNNKNEEVVNLK